MVLRAFRIFDVSIFPFILPLQWVEIAVPQITPSGNKVKLFYPGGWARLKR